MAKELSKSGILTGADILAGHVTQSVDALTGIEAYDITISGSLEVTGSVLIDGLASNAQSNVLTYNTSSGQLYYTASSAIGGGGGPTPNLQQVTTQGAITTVSITGSNISASGTIHANSASLSGLLYPTSDGLESQLIITDGAGTLSFGNARDVSIIVKNISGGPLTKGTPIHATSSASPPSGNISEVVAASASIASHMPATFILNEDLADGAEGEGLIVGFIKNISTTGFTQGDILYVSPDGGYTNIKPTGSNLIQNIGIAVKIHGSNGSATVYGSGRSNDIPNISPGYAWVGNSDSVATPTATSSIQNVVSSSYALTSSYALNAGSGGGSVGTLQQVTDSGSVTTNAITSSALYVLNGTNISPNGDGVGQLQIHGAGYTSYLTMDSSSAYLGHNSLVRDFSFQTNETTRLTLLQNGNISASGDIQALSFTGVAGTTNNLTSSYAITASHALNGGSGSPAFPFTGDAQITGSLVVSGSFSPHGNGNTNGIIIGEGAAHIGTAALDNGHIAIGDTAQANMFGVAIGTSATAGVDNISIGYKAGANHGTNSRGQIAIGTEIQPTTDADNSINFSANDQNISVFSPSEPKTFGVYLGSSTADSPDLKFIVGPESSSYWSGSGNFGFNTKTPNSPLAVEGSGSTIFDVQGSQGQLFSVTDDLLDEVFSVSDISGDPLLTVSGSGLVEIPVGPLHVTGSGIKMALPSGSGFKSYGVPGYSKVTIPYNTDTIIFQDENFYLEYNDAGTDQLEAKVTTDPSSGTVDFVYWNNQDDTYVTFEKNAADIEFDIDAAFTNWEKATLEIFSTEDSSYPTYHITFNSADNARGIMVLQKFV